MNSSDIQQTIQKEMNRRRRHGGAEDVPAVLWGGEEVAASVQQIATICCSEKFDGDWDQATLRIEEGMDALAAALRKASIKQNAYQPTFDGVGTNARRSMLTSQQAMHDLEAGTESVGYRYFPYFPSVARQDAGGLALAEYLTWHWQNNGWSRFVRERVCGDEYLSREEAWEFLTSGLPKVMDYDDYERLGLCPARTKGRILSKHLKVDGLLFMSNMARIDPKTHKSTATTDTLLNETHHYCVEISMPKARSSAHRLKRLVLKLDEDRYHYITSRITLPDSYEVQCGQGRDSYISPHPAPYFEGQDRYVEGYAASVMADLIGTAEMFSGQYSVSIWDMLEACLTGRFPPQPAVTISSSQTRTIDDDGPDEVPSGRVHTGFSAQGPATLTVQPWVTPEALADAWREFRQSNPAYSPSEKQADTLQFVLSHTAPGAAFRWDDLAKLWQKERGERVTRSQIFKQFQRAQAAILPNYCDLEQR